MRFDPQQHFNLARRPTPVAALHTMRAALRARLDAIGAERIPLVGPQGRRNLSDGRVRLQRLFYEYEDQR